MLDHTPSKLIFIRACIFLLRYAPIIEVLLIFAVSFPLLYTPPALQHYSHFLRAALYPLLALYSVELLYLVFVYTPHKRRLLGQADHPLPRLTRSERSALFERVVGNVSDLEGYLRLWFLDGDPSEIKRENVREFLLWAFFERDVPPPVQGSTNTVSDSGAVTSCQKGDDGMATANGFSEGGGYYEVDRDEEEEIDAYITRTEELLGRKFPPGRGSAKSLRLTLDAVHTQYRSVIWYGIVGLIDLVTHAILSAARFAYHPPTPHSLASHPRAPSRAATTPMTVFPPRLQHILPFAGGRGRHNKSPSTEIGYWYRPHKSKTGRLPVVFIHGIGIGLWPYTRFLAELNSSPSEEEEEQIGILALEILPVSMRLTDPPLPRTEFLRHMTKILAQCGTEWDGFVLVSHSYGSVLTTHILKDQDLGPRVKRAVLIDPVSIMLHLPDVAYNFTRRPPRMANEWQLWYFASMDLGVAEGLGRHFFWRDNIIWREELLDLDPRSGEKRAIDDDNPDNNNNGITRRLQAQQQQMPSGSNRNERKRKVVVCLSGKDLITNTRAVARYLASDEEHESAKHTQNEDVEQMLADMPADQRSTCRHYLAPSGIEILWFPQLDHAHVFEERRAQDRVVDVIRRCSVKEEEEDVTPK
ncbi:hypothetical protein QBC46DRAFT_436291 [Diplogelasinospora grovesii]|uniref:AB hydrolase-1 domain-containing protein n=1 Tax=Diplogelasinospora grovesii TaxID=303347 RepID=A0AAN6N933_9PEZI|nr:hypothetical protein QBC46DRAFT_436291 [Diplogelasinospora grovesii]